MRMVSIDDVESAPIGEGSVRRGLSAPLGTTDVTINHYRIGPGEGLSGGLHAHVDQEEVFVVLDGEATFETLEGEITVERGEALRVPPGEFQSGRNASETTLRVLALGAPRDTADTRIPAECPDCGHDTLRLETDDGITFECPGCTAAHQPDTCPDCGTADLQFTLDTNGEPVVACQHCDATFEQPPLRD